MHVLFTLAGIFWTLGILLLPGYFALPMHDFIWPVLAVFAFKLIHSVSLYRARVPCGWRDRLGAAVAGMALTHTIGKAVFTGVIHQSRPFLRTPKSTSQHAIAQGLAMAREETMVAGALVFSALVIMTSYGADNTEALWWGLILLVQSIPYFAALMIGVVSGMPAREVAATPSSLPAAVSG